MDLDLDFSECMEGIRNALAGFVSHARKAGLDAPVPTAPEWTVRDLVVHQGMVHRWATAHILGKEANSAPFHDEGMAAQDPVIWLHDGGLDLIRALQSASPDLEAMVFLKNAPAPRQFWARRQCHETTIHSVDAQGSGARQVPPGSGHRDHPADRARRHRRAAQRLPHPRPVEPAQREAPAPGHQAATTSRRSWLVHVSGEPPVVEQDSQRARRPGARGALRRRSTSRCGTGPTRSRARPTTSGATPPR